MATGPDGKTIIIVKKVVGHGGHHGGSWKVAYADFVTSMMAFFMVLWLVNSASSPVRERVASYFRRPGVFEKGSGTPLELGGAGILSESFAPPAQENSQTEPDVKIYRAGTEEGVQRDIFGEGGGEGKKKHTSATETDALPKQEVVIESKSKGNKGLGEGESATKALMEQKNMQQLAAEIKQALKGDGKAVTSFIGQIEVKVDQKGLHLEIMDTDKTSMFTKGSAAVQLEADKELQKIVEILKKLPNPIDIEGHTDAAPYRGKNSDNYDNWNLSTDRANAARRIFQKAGIRDSQISRVIGYSSQRLRKADDPLNSMNRRISISMRFTEQARIALDGLQVAETKSMPVKKVEEMIRREATKNVAATNAVVAPSASSGSNSPQSGLKIEVGVPTPDPTFEEENFSQKGEEELPIWAEKDKIFGSKNPFEVK